MSGHDELRSPAEGAGRCHDLHNTLAIIRRQSLDHIFQRIKTGEGYAPQPTAMPKQHQEPEE